MMECAHVCLFWEMAGRMLSLWGTCAERGACCRVVHSRLSHISVACFSQVTHTVLVTPDVLDMVRHGSAMGDAGSSRHGSCGSQPSSAFRGAVEKLMLFFKASPLSAVHSQNIYGVYMVCTTSRHKQGSQDKLPAFTQDTYKEVFRFEDPPLHDPCAVAFAAEPLLFKVGAACAADFMLRCHLHAPLCKCGRVQASRALCMLQAPHAISATVCFSPQGCDMRVDIETASHLSAGQTVCDIWSQTGRPHNCHVTTAMDVAAFWRVMGAALAAADSCSPLNQSGPSS